MLSTTCMPVLFKEISDDLGLDLVQIGAVWGILVLGSIFIMPLGGWFCDRLGVRRTLILVSILAGLTGALRGLSFDFMSLMGTAFLWGLVSSIGIPALTKGASMSVSRQQQGMAQGLIGTGGGIGAILGPLISATIVSPWLGGWRNVLFLYGAVSVFIGLLWLFTVREPERIKSVDSESKVPLRQAFSHLWHVKAIWLLGLTLLAQTGCNQGMIGFLPLYLRGNGWLAAAADGTLAVFSGIGMLAVIPLTLLSDRTGSRKSLLGIAYIVNMLAVGLLSVIHNEMTWLLIVMSGIFSSVTPSLVTTMTIENKEVGTAHSGTAIGLVIGIANIGWVIAPPIGNSLAGISFGLPFVFWAALALGGFIITIFLKETGGGHTSK
jgi:ACS family glucarate transporter-like MFS transporter